ncbi:pilus (MSHA type) biogenesis protein MshL [Methylophilus medardicus]|uniref:Pilus (MSHA type) biogenesis protein MshL n=1 Tax=Methylophilus medardicus TaxID=2588534 RepID=A0A5B8CQ99_9PROT|nr:pilus (MSHA type) biogenesis protein MshL [Methylophilus medardicus]QDC43434.1 pilus (MSHA type) biogenesis protein MshL [Methylophilus medardicus]QDC48441.1 pilus (MSHA type) biogenesis protein MshL [Methylophilus medardicus]QDC52146.1 pilus (MSHA type) biogenesis protein MshL [Methylophilus medardicus]
MKTFVNTLGLMIIGTGLVGCTSNPFAPSNVSINPKIQNELATAVAKSQSQVTPPPKEVTDELFEPAKIEAPKALAKRVEPRFDLVVNKAPAAQVLMGIVSGSPYSIALSPELKGEISINLRDVTLFEALNSLRDLYGYEYKMNGKQIFVEPQTIQTRVFQVNYITGSRRGTSATRVTSGTASGSGAGGAAGVAGQAAVSNGFGNGTGTGVATGAGASGASNLQVYASDVSMRTNNDFWEEIGASLSGLVGEENGRKVIINAQSGIIMVKAMPKEIRQVEKFLSLMQVTVDRQVILEAKIIKVQLNRNSQQGINWAAVRNIRGRDYTFGNVDGNTTLGETGALTNGTLTSTVPGALSNSAPISIGGSMFALAVQGKNFSALLNFLETQGNVEVLSSPRIATINNQKAVLKVGNDAFYVTNVRTNVTTTTGGAIVTPDIQLQPYFSGISLDVTPQIDKDDNITLHVHPFISDVTQVNRTVNLSSANGGTYTIPTASSNINETDSIVRTKDGNVIAIGGLMSESVDNTRTKVPGLGDVKFLGNLFRQKDQASTKTELVILLKSTVVRGGESWAQDLLDSQDRVDKLKSDTSF